MNFWASLEYAVGVMIGSCSVTGVVGAKYRNHYAQIVMVGISASTFITLLKQQRANWVVCLASTVINHRQWLAEHRQSPLVWDIYFDYALIKQ